MERVWKLEDNLLGIGFLLPFGFWESNSAHQARGEAPVSTKPNLLPERAVFTKHQIQHDVLHL